MPVNDYFIGLLNYDNVGGTETASLLLKLKQSSVA